MVVALWVALGGLIILLASTLAGRYLERRNRPHCPVHNCPMDLFGDMEYEEYVCPVAGCTWCADVYDDGEFKIFNT